jgi:hypothetical protein
MTHVQVHLRTFPRTLPIDTVELRSHVIACASVMLWTRRYEKPTPRAVRKDLDMASVHCRIGAAVNAALGWPRSPDTLYPYGLHPELPCGGFDGAFARAENIFDLGTWFEGNDGDLWCFRVRGLFSPVQSPLVHTCPKFAGALAWLRIHACTKESHLSSHAPKTSW